MLVPATKGERLARTRRKTATEDEDTIRSKNRERIHTSPASGGIVWVVIVVARILLAVVMAAA
jgi:hypothetical protein